MAAAPALVPAAFADSCDAPDEAFLSGMDNREPREGLADGMTLRGLFYCN